MNSSAKLNDDPRPHPSLSWTNQDNLNVHKTCKTTIKDILSKFGRKQWWFGREIKNRVETELDKSKQRTRFKRSALTWHPLGPVTPMDAPRVWWYDIVEVLRKIRIFDRIFDVSRYQQIYQRRKELAIFETTVKEQILKWSLYDPSLITLSPTWHYHTTPTHATLHIATQYQLNNTGKKIG